MRLCPQGHPIPDWAATCPKCDQAARSRWQRGRTKAFDPSVYFAGSTKSDDPKPAQSTALPPHKRTPHFIRTSQRQPGSTSNRATSTPQIPGMILRGIKRLLAAVCPGSTLEAILRQDQVDPVKIRRLIDAHHPFVMDVRERWFAVFTRVLSRLEARIIARDFGLDGRPPVRNKVDLAQRCHLSVADVGKLKASGLSKLKSASSRRLLTDCVSQAARQVDQ